MLLILHNVVRYNYMNKYRIQLIIYLNIKFITDPICLDAQ